MPKPSDQIRNIIPSVAKQRLRKASKMSGQLIVGAAEVSLLDQLGQDPMTWVIAIMTYLDNQDQSAERPSTRLRPDLSVDGNQYCALYGLNLQEGIGGFGDTPELAMVDFDKNWNNHEANRSVLRGQVIAREPIPAEQRFRALESTMEELRSIHGLI